MRRPPLPAPTVRQLYALCWLLGLLAGAWLPACLLLLAVLLVLDPRLFPWRHPARSLLVLLLFAAGFLPVRHLLTPPSAPGWTTALIEAPARERPRLCGHIRSVSGLPDDRLRMLLDGVRPEDVPDAAPLPGLVAWTWDAPARRPLPARGRRPAPVVRAAVCRLRWRSPPDASSPAGWVHRTRRAGRPGVDGQRCLPGRRCGFRRYPALRSCSYL